jgi:Protein of unknown function (DUF3421)
MKPFLWIALTCIIQTCVFAQSESINDNVLIINPLSPSLEDNDVTVTFDAARGNGRLAGIREAVYIHTGVLTNQSKSPSDWKYIQTQWGTADMRWKMTPMGNNRYTFRIGNIRQFYHLHAGEIVKQLAFVFRNANGSMIGKNANNSDIFINVTNSTPIQAQNGTIVTLNSTMPTLDDPNIVVTFDANIGNRQLLGTQDVYIHTGVLTAQSKSPSDWKYIQTQWSAADMRWKMTPIGNNRYTFKIGNIRQFYKIPNSETVLQLAFVFRNANASLIGKNANQSDIFIPINGQNTNNNTVNNTSNSNNVIINNNTNVVQNNNASSSKSNGNEQWIRVVNGLIPTNALVAGNEADGSPLYIARASYQGGLQVGKANSKTAFIVYGGKEYSIQNYEVFIGTGKWVAATSNNFPSNAIIGGKENDGTLLYIARAKLSNGIHTGKVHKNGQAWIGYGGTEYTIEQYEVLTTNSNSEPGSNHSSNSSNVVLNNNTVNNSSSSNNVIINNNNSSARSNSTINNNGNRQQPANNNNTPQGSVGAVKPVQKINLSILQNTSTSDKVGFIYHLEKICCF